MTFRFSSAGRVLAALSMVLLLSSAVHLDASAQLEGTPVAIDPGTLAVSVFSCTDGAADPEIAAAAPSCPETGTATLWIDGAGPIEIKDGATQSLDVGDHTVATTEAGPGSTVTIFSGETTTVIVVLHAAPPEVPTTSVKIVVHQCQDKIKSLDDLDALGDFPTKLGRCPAAPAPYDLSVTDGATTFTLADAKKDGEGYKFKKVAKGPVTIVETTAPAGTVFGTAALDPASSDPSLQSDPDHATATLDLTNVDNVTLHIFNFPAPGTNRVSIVTHLCGSITAKADFQALPDFAHQLLACPVTTLPGDAGPSGLFHADPIAFDYSIADANGAATTLASATFKSEDLCETDIQQDLNNDGQISSNLCIDGSHYQFDGVAQGGVLVSQTTAPGGFRLGTVLIAPGDPGKTGKVDLKKETIALDTSEVGDLTIHVFEFAVPPPAGFGSVQIVKLWCNGASTETIAMALAPGAQATQSDLGDSSCIAGNADFRISLFGGDPGQAFNAGDSGITTITDLPATTDATGPHVVTELSTGTSASFLIAADQTTRVIFLNYTAVDNSGGNGSVDASASGDPFVVGDGSDGGGDFVVEDFGGGGVYDESAPPTDGGGAVDVVSGDGLPVTGIGPAKTRDGAEVAVLFGALSGGLLIALRLARRRPI